MQSATTSRGSDPGTRISPPPCGPIRTIGSWRLAGAWQMRVRARKNLPQCNWASDQLRQARRSRWSGMAKIGVRSAVFLMHSRMITAFLDYTLLSRLNHAPEHAYMGMRLASYRYTANFPVSHSHSEFIPSRFSYLCSTTLKRSRSLRMSIENKDEPAQIETLTETNSFKRSAKIIRRPPKGSATNGNVGIGISFGVTSNKDVYVTALVSGGSAESSGSINVGDRILAVDGADVAGLPVSDIVKLIIGQPGTTVSLDILSRTADSPPVDEQPSVVPAASPAEVAPAVATPSAQDDAEAVERKYKVPIPTPRRRSAAAVSQPPPPPPPQALAKEMVKKAIRLPTGSEPAHVRACAKARAHAHVVLARRARMQTQRMCGRARRTRIGWRDTHFPPSRFPPSRFPPSRFPPFRFLPSLCLPCRFVPLIPS